MATNDSNVDEMGKGLSFSEEGGLTELGGMERWEVMVLGSWAIGVMMRVRL